MKTALITGSNRGLGLTLLKRFAEDGYDVIAHTRLFSKEWDAVCRELEKQYSIKVYNIYFDLNRKEDVEKGMQEIQDMDIPIDVLVNNAGVNASTKPLMYITYDDLTTTFMVNYFSLTMITKEIASIMMRGSGGSIINISSCMGGGHQPGGTCYDASKAAVNQFTRTAAQEFAPFGIRVNAVACGVMNAGMSSNLSEKSFQKLVKASALKRPAETDEIANVVLFLASEKASYITGSVINVEGGAIL